MNTRSELNSSTVSRRLAMRAAISAWQTPGEIHIVKMYTKFANFTINFYNFTKFDMFFLAVIADFVFV